MRKFGVFSVALLTVFACGSAPSVIERVVDVDDSVQGSLLAPEAKNDLPLSYCATNKCYTYTEEDIVKIKKYIAQLEVRLRRCNRPEHTE